VDWAKDKKEVWYKLCDERGAPEAKRTWDYATWSFQDWIFRRTWTVCLSINKARKLGWTTHVDSYDNFTETFDTFEKQGLLPPRL
jgi:hypothetical protein